MNKNTFLAFSLILVAVFIFTSPTYQRFYYEKLLNQPYPPDLQKERKTQPPAPEATKLPEAPEETIAPAESRILAMEQDTTEITTPADTVWIETEDILVGISEDGARIVSLRMKKFNMRTKKEGKPEGQFVELIREKSAGGAGLTINAVNFDGRRFVTKGDKKNYRVGEGDTVSVAFETTGPFGGQLEKRFLFAGNGYRIGLSVQNRQLQSNLLTVSWPGGIRESESCKMAMYQTDEKKAHYSNGESVDHVKMTKEGQETPSGSFRWVGMSSKYFFIAMVADTTHNSDIKIKGFPEEPILDKNGKKDKSKSFNYSVSYQFMPQSNVASLWFYAGPSDYDRLKSFELKFEDILFPVLGWTRIFFFSEKWFPPLAEFVLWLLLALFNIVKDYGVAIVLLTVLSKVVTYPLTQSSIKSMNRMKDLQPKINVIRAKHKGNPKKMNEEMMALYKSEGVNPLNPGCLPMFLQMPIFISLFVVLQKAIELRGAGTVLVPWIHDLSQPEQIFSIAGIIPGGIPFYGTNFAILPIIMAVLTYFQNKMTIKDPNQKMMIYFMPIFMLVLFNSFPAGLVLYWTMSNALGLVQQYYTDKRKAAQAPAVAVQTKPARKKVGKR